MRGIPTGTSYRQNLTVESERVSEENDVEARTGDLATNDNTHPGHNVQVDYTGYPGYLDYSPGYLDAILLL